MAITSKEINLAQLDQELGGKGLIADFNDPDNKIILPADGVTLTEKKLSDAIKAHVAQPTEADVRAAQRQLVLDRLGITAEEAQLLLGGN
jgi:hypothetical protein